VNFTREFQGEGIGDDNEGRIVHGLSTAISKSKIWQILCYFEAPKISFQQKLDSLKFYL